MISKKLQIILAGVFLLIVIGNAALYFSAPRIPSLDDIRADPAKFSLNDYPSRERLQARLSALFPGATSRTEIEDFFAQTDIELKRDHSGECTYNMNAAHIIFVFDQERDTLRSIHIDEDSGVWPVIREICAKAPSRLTPAADHANEAPIHLPLMPLEIEE
ncbi:MAG: hypothetical protein ACK4VI_06520 [Alphaproteobacteria bacterium]